MFSILPKLESDYIFESLRENRRLDNRSFDSFRDISIKRLEENGQVIARIGNTAVLGQIYSSLIAPYTDRPAEGQIIFSVDTSHLRHSAECNGANEDVSELRNRIGNLLEKSLKESK